uniref:Uncharacterized protein n=1 Tax=Anguilla anguilla TaxID=7936 RepID=A0A0E9WC69_ANGAN
MKCFPCEHTPITGVSRRSPPVLNLAIPNCALFSPLEEPSPPVQFPQRRQDYLR